MEADLAFRGVDLRDLHRPGMRLTYRRLHLLVMRLGLVSSPMAPMPDSLTWRLLEAEEVATEKPTADRIRERQAYYDKKGAP